MLTSWVRVWRVDTDGQHPAREAVYAYHHGVSDKRAIAELCVNIHRPLSNFFLRFILRMFLGNPKKRNYLGTYG